MNPNERRTLFSLARQELGKDTLACEFAHYDKSGLNSGAFANQGFALLA